MQKLSALFRHGLSGIALTLHYISKCRPSSNPTLATCPTIHPMDRLQLRIILEHVNFMHPRVPWVPVCGLLASVEYLTLAFSRRTGKRETGENFGVWCPTGPRNLRLSKDALINDRVSKEFPIRNYGRSRAGKGFPSVRPSQPHGIWKDHPL